MEKVYRLIGESKGVYSDREKFIISETGAKIIWTAYEFLYGKHCQTMDGRESRGGIAYLSEIEHWKKEGALPADFNWMDYKI